MNRKNILILMLGILGIASGVFGYAAITNMRKWFANQPIESVSVDPCSIGWMDQFKISGITYHSIKQKSDLKYQGAEIGTIGDTLEGKVCDNHPLQDGEATVLEKGTAVYALTNYSKNFRLGIIKYGSLWVYEVSQNFSALFGKEFYDLKEKVIQIEIFRDGMHSEASNIIRQITDPREIDAVIDWMYTAKNEKKVPDCEAGSTFYSMHFHLLDGTISIREYWRECNLMDGFVLPLDFQNLFPGMQKI